MSAWLSIALVAAACTSAAPEASPSSAAPDALQPAPPSHSYWAYERTLLPPRDDTTYENVLLDAKALSDGGWIVVRDRRPARWLVDPTIYGPLIKNPTGEILRLDANGNVVAKEHAAEPLGVTRVEVFEDQGAVVAIGPAVRNGNVHALRLDTLDGVATDLLTDCVHVADHCWTYRGARYMGSTELEERDPRTLAVLRTFPHLTMDNVPARPAIFPRLNLIAWARPYAVYPSPPSSRIRVEPLDPSAPVAVPWLERLRTACDVRQLSDNSALVQFGPPDCSGDAGWASEIVEVSTGRVLRRITDDGFSGNDLAAGRLILAATGLAIDPRTGEPGPVLTDKIVGLDFQHGVAVVRLTNGGAAVLRRHDGSARPRDVDVRTIASGRCGDVDFPRLVVGPADVACAGMSIHLERGQIFLAPGRDFQKPVDLEIVRMKIEAATRQIELTYRATALVRGPPDKTGPGTVIAFEDPPTGEWLVRLASEASSFGFSASFAVSFSAAKP